MRKYSYGSVMLLGLMGSQGVLAAPAGDAVRANNGSTFSANAADAIQVTCGALVGAVDNNGNNATAEQNDLRTNCGNMVRTTLAVLGEGAVNNYGFDSGDQVLNALRQFSGEESSSQGRYATEMNNRQFSVVNSRMSAIRQGSRGASGVGFNLQGAEVIAQTNAAPNSGIVPAMIGGSAGAAGDTGIAWFANLDYGFGDRDGSINENGYEYDAYEISLGADYAWDNGWAIGGIASYSDNDVDFDDDGATVASISGGSIETDGYTISAFAQYQADAYYVSGVLGFGSLDHDMERRVQFSSFGTAGSPDRLMVGDTESDQLSGQVTVGRVFGTGATTFDVYAGLDYLTVDVDGYTEDDTATNGGLNLAFEDQDIDSLQSMLGVTVRQTVSLDAGGVFIPYAGLEWRHEFDNDARTVDARYANALPGNPTGTNFAMPTDDPDEDFGEITLGLSLQMRNSTFVFVQWQVAVGLEDAESNLITAGIRGTF
ncbi:MAG: autotransporter outer membrane beta-barrel domain-containing protein [Pseudomonadales bacterium]